MAVLIVTNLRMCSRIPPANVFRCQERSFFEMLNDGIRVFDMRYAYNPGNDTIGFHHCMYSWILSEPPALTKHQAQALLAPTTQLEDVFFGFYYWLDQHPTEAVLISLNYEGDTGTPNDVKIQQHIYNFFSTELAKRYWVQKNGTVCPLTKAKTAFSLSPARYNWRSARQAYPPPALWSWSPQFRGPAQPNRYRPWSWPVDR